jgi:hypothetical protein
MAARVCHEVIVRFRVRDRSVVEGTRMRCSTRSIRRSEMIPSLMRPGLILLAAVSCATASGHLPAPPARSPLDALLAFVQEDVRTVVPSEMRPYEIGRLFLRADSRAPERNALGSIGQDVVDRLHVEIVDDTMHLEHMMVRLPGGGAHIREEGVYVSVGTVELEAPDTLAITFALSPRHFAISRCARGFAARP